MKKSDNFADKHRFNANNIKENDLDFCGIRR